MRSATKKIKRATEESASRAMMAHIELMKSKGWKIDKQFGGDAGCMYECVTWFYKG